MYQVIVTEDFINTLCEIPLRYLSVLARSFLLIEKIDAVKENEVPHDGTCIIEMLEQMRNQELE